MTNRRTVFPLLAAALLLATVVPLAAAQDAPLKIAVFDPQRVSDETEEGKRVQAALAQLRDAKQQEIAAKSAKIEELQNQLTQQALSLSAERRTQIEMQIQRLALDLENARDLASRELQLEIAAAQQKFNDRLLRAVVAYGQAQGFDLILDSSVIAFASPRADVTTGIIDTFDSLAPPPAAGD